MRFTKRKEKHPGRYNAAESFSIKVDGENLGTIQAIIVTSGVKYWFWYGLGHNTLSREHTLITPRVFVSPEDALKDFKKFYKEN